MAGADLGLGVMNAAVVFSTALPQEGTFNYLFALLVHPQLSAGYRAVLVLNADMAQYILAAVHPPPCDIQRRRFEPHPILLTARAALNASAHGRESATKPHNPFGFTQRPQEDMKLSKTQGRHEGLLR